MMTEREAIFADAISVITAGVVKTDKKPVIFTSCCKKEAEAFVAAKPDDYALIHSTPAGKKLEELDLFKHMSPKLAYLFWFFLSSRFVIENEFPRDVHFFANFSNPTSTAFGIEIPLLFNTKPNVLAITNPLVGVTLPRNQWMENRLMRPYVLGLMNLYNLGPDHHMTADEAILHTKFSEATDGMPSTTDPLEYRFEIALKMMTLGYLGEFGKFAVDDKQRMTLRS